MRVLPATEVKNRLGDALSFNDDDSLLIERYGKEACMAFTVKTAKRMVLTSYAHGGMSRDAAMNLLGLNWYGELLDELAAAHIDRPCLPAGERSAMVAHATKTLGGGK